MQFILALFSSHNFQLAVIGILGIAIGLVLRLTPAPGQQTIASAQKKWPREQPNGKVYSEREVKEERRLAAERAVALFLKYRAAFTEIPQEFWGTVADDEFLDLMAIGLTRSDRIPNVGLVFLVEALTEEGLEPAATVMGALYTNDAAIKDLRRFAERVKGYKAGKA